MATLSDIKPRLSDCAALLSRPDNEVAFTQDVAAFIERFCKVQTASKHTFMGINAVSGVLWIAKKDYASSELKALRKTVRYLGATRSFIAGGGDFVGYAISHNVEQNQSMSAYISTVSYIDAIKDSIFSSDNGDLRTPHFALFSSSRVVEEIEFIKPNPNTLTITNALLQRGHSYLGVVCPEAIPERLTQSLLGDIEYFNESHLTFTESSMSRLLKNKGDSKVKQIRVIIYLSEEGERLVCGFFEDGTIVPSLDVSYAATVSVASIIELLSGEIEHITEFLDDSEWGQIYYLIDERSDELSPKNKAQKNILSSQTNAKRKKQQRNLAICGALLVVGAIGSMQWYLDYTSDASQRQRELERIESEKIRKENQDARDDRLRQEARNFMSQSQYIYLPTQALKTALLNVLPLPTIITEGKKLDAWKLESWNCLSSDDITSYIPEGITYKCLINYVGEQLAQPEMFKRWVATEKVMRHLKTDDVVGAKKTANSGLLSFSFNVKPSSFNWNASIKDDDLIREMKAIQAKSSSGIAFEYGSNSLTMTNSNDVAEGIRLLKEVNDLIAPVTYYDFKVQTKIGTLGASSFSLPTNTSVKRIGGSGENITIEGVIKYADKI